jgi:hypothetical protein
VQSLSVSGSANFGPVGGSRDSTLRLGVHPDAQIGFGVSDLFSDSVPLWAVTPASPGSECFNLDAEEARHSVGIEQGL